MCALLIDQEAIADRTAAPPILVIVQHRVEELKRLVQTQ